MLISEAVWKILQHGAVSAIIHLTANLVMEKGWMSERFCHSEGLVKERYPDGSLASTWFALMPWACGSILEGLTGEAWDLTVRR